MHIPIPEQQQESQQAVEDRLPTSMLEATTTTTTTTPTPNDRIQPSTTTRNHSEASGPPTDQDATPPAPPQTRKRKASPPQDEMQTPTPLPPPPHPAAASRTSTASMVPETPHRTPSPQRSLGSHRQQRAQDGIARGVIPDSEGDDEFGDDDEGDAEEYGWGDEGIVEFGDVIVVGGKGGLGGSDIACN